jgi:hypothetical protein
MKQVIRLTENDLHNIIEESVRKILNEYGGGEKSQEQLGIAYMMAMIKVRDRYDKYWWRAKKIAIYASEMREKYGIPMKYFIDGMNKAKKRYARTGVALYR